PHPQALEHQARAPVKPTSPPLAGCRLRHSRSQKLHPEFVRGLRDSIAMMIGIIPVAIAFGYFAQKQGLSWPVAAALSGIVYAGPSQFVAVSLIGIGATIPTIVAATAIVNLRYVLYAASLAPYLSGTSVRRLLLLAYGLVDGAYAVTIAHCRRHPE